MPPDTDTPAAVAPPVRWGRRIALGLLALVALVLLVTAGISTWVWRSEAGAHWALQRVPGLQVEGWQGAPGQRTLGAARLVQDTPAGTLTLENVRIHGFNLVWRPAPGMWWRLEADSAHADLVRWQSKPSDAPSSGAPESLRAPVALRIPALSIDRLLVDDVEPITGIRADLALGDDAGSVHRVRAFVAQTRLLRLGGQLALEADAPLTTTAALGLRSIDQGDGAPPFAAGATVQGPLAQLALRAELEGRGMALHAAGDVKPFAAWPLGDFTLTSRALDLAALAEGAPRTRLDVDATVRSAGLTQPAEVRLHAANAAAGRWDAGALPVQALTLAVSGTPEPLRDLTITDLQLDLLAGRIAGSGQVRLDGARHAVTLDLTATDVQPAQLDARAPAMRLSGPLTLTAADLHTYPAGDWQAGVQTRLRGALTGAAATPVALQLDASANASGLALTTAHAEAGPAQAHVQGRVNGPVFGPGRPWQWALQGALREFNPALWWPGTPGSAWRTGPHRINLTLQTDGNLPASAAADPLAQWRALAGQLQLDVADSVLAGVPITAQAQARMAGEASTGEARLTLGRDRVTLTRRAAGEPLVLDVDAAHLADLAPLVRLAPGGSAWAPASGQLSTRLTLHHLLSGTPLRWQVQGEASGVQTPSASLGSARWQGEGEARLEAPLALSVSLSNLIQGPPTRKASAGPAPKIDTATLDVSGTLAAHRVRLDAASPLRPPEWFDQALGVNSRSGSALRLDVAGTWVSQAAKGQPWWRAGRWQGRVADLHAGAKDGSGAPWVAAKDLALQATWNAQGVQAASAEPGRITLPGTALAWREARWTPARWAVDADIEAFALAPLLARVQPEMGWRGDLTLGGHIKATREARFDADVVFERQHGDLALANDPRAPEGSARPLGLETLRLALAAHDGRWQFTPALAGRQLGELAGVLAVQTTPARPWPHEDAPLSGVLQMRIERLAAWSTWLPPGWRMDGQLASTAQFGGRFGAPEVRGNLTGQDVAMRNLLEGVALTDGQIDIGFDGLAAQIRRFTFKGGDGTLDLAGQAQLGAQPKADLQVRLARFQALGRIDRRVIVSGQANAQLDAERIAVNGEVRVDEGLIDISQGGAPTLADDITVVRSSGIGPTAATQDAPEPEPEPLSEAARKLALRLDIHLGEKLRLKGRGIDTGLRGDLQLTSPDGQPQLHGVVRTHGGLYAAYGQRLTISRGEISFLGPIDQPRLDILAVRPNLDIEVGVAVTGRPANPRVRLISEPEMSDMDKLSWLMLGRAPEGLGQSDTALLQRAAMALLAGEEEGMTDAMLRSLGITDFGISQTDDGSVRDTVVTLGRQISQRWYVGYAHSVNKASGTWQLIYRMARRFTLRLSAGAQDSSAEAIWMWRWD